MNQQISVTNANIFGMLGQNYKDIVYTMFFESCYDLLLERPYFLSWLKSRRLKCDNRYLKTKAQEFKVSIAEKKWNFQYIA